MVPNSVYIANVRSLITTVFVPFFSFFPFFPFFAFLVLIIAVTTSPIDEQKDDGEVVNSPKNDLDVHVTPASFQSSSMRKSVGKGNSKPYVPRPDSVHRYPFEDDGNVGDLLFNLPSDTPEFSTVGQAARSRLAKQVFSDMAQGRRGMRVCDIPTGLRALGLPVEKALEKAFKGRSKENNVNLQQWQNVVKKFVVRDVSRKQQAEAKAQAEAELVVKVFGNVPHEGTQDTGPVDPAAHQRSDNQDLYRNVFHDLAVGQTRLNTIIRQSTSDSNADSYYEGDKFLKAWQNSGGNNGDNNMSCKDIADRFLNGPVGREMYHLPDGSAWWDAETMLTKQQEQIKELELLEGLDEDGLPGTMLGADDMFDDMEDDEALQNERILLRSLQLHPTIHQNNGTSHMSLARATDLGSSSQLQQQGVENLQGNLSGVKKKFVTVGEQLAMKREIQKAIDKETTSLPGWKKKNGGWSVEFRTDELNRKVGDASMAATPSYASIYESSSVTSKSNKMLSAETMNKISKRVKDIPEPHLMSSKKEKALQIEKGDERLQVEERQNDEASLAVTTTITTASKTSTSNKSDMSSTSNSLVVVNDEKSLVVVDDEDRVIVAEDTSKSSKSSTSLVVAKEEQKDGSKEETTFKIVSVHKDFKKQLVDIYTLYNPTKVNTIDNILLNYNGDKKGLLKIIATKYNIPVDFSSNQSVTSVSTTSSQDNEGSNMDDTSRGRRESVGYDIADTYDNEEDQDSKMVTYDMATEKRRASESNENSSTSMTSESEPTVMVSHKVLSTGSSSGSISSSSSKSQSEKKSEKK
jgi:hypothetical protein